MPQGLVAILALLLLAGCATTVGSADDSATTRPAKEGKTYAIEYSPGSGWLKGKPFFEQPLGEHGRYMHHLYEEGKLVMGGPFTDNGGGLAIIKAADDAEAKQIVANDPAVKGHIFVAEVHAWYQVDWGNFER